MSQGSPPYRPVSSEEGVQPSPNGNSKEEYSGHFISPTQSTQGVGPQEHKSRRNTESRPAMGFGLGTENPMEGRCVHQMSQKQQFRMCMSLLPRTPGVINNV